MARGGGDSAKHERRFVTVLLTDTQGSSRLWQDAPGLMERAVPAFEELVDQVVAAHHGVRPLEQGEGDSFVGVFATPSDAVACAVAVQEALIDSPIRLRMAVHAGEVLVREAGQYMGATMNRAGRLRDLAHGGQILLSQAVRDLVAEALPEDVRLRDLGMHELRDLHRPEFVHQVLHPGLPAEFPPLRGTRTARHNLPADLTSFVGRQAELAVLRKVAQEVRLLTLLGPGGAGKTRLAVHLGNGIVGQQPDGVWFVDLASISSGDLLPSTVLAALGTSEERGYDVMTSLTERLRDAKVALILDNCEHLVAHVAPFVVDLVRRCPSLRIIATSREPIGVAGEVTWPVPALAVPIGSEECESMELFLARARQARPDYEPDEREVEQIGEICRRLDGIPLAIELAAARIRVMSAHQIREALADRFRLLTGSGRHGVPRQQTLRASVDWSHDLLTEPERVVFRRLSVFAGAFTLADAEAIVAGHPIESTEVLDIVTRLVERSLVHVDARGHDTRFRLLETMRQYGGERLVVAGEDAAMRRRQAEWALEFAMRAGRGMLIDTDAWLHRVDAAVDDLHVAVEWARTHDPDVGVRALAALVPFWSMRGRFTEALTLLASIADPTDPLVVAERDIAVAQLRVISREDTPEDFERVDDAVETFRKAGDRWLECMALMVRGWLGMDRGAMTTNLALLEEALELGREVGNPWVVAETLQGTGFAHLLPLGDVGRGRELLAESVSVARQSGNAFTERWSTIGLGICDLAEGRLDEGHQILVDAIDDARRDGDRWSEVMAGGWDTQALLWSGRVDEAEEDAIETLARTEGLGGYAQAHARLTLALVHVVRGRGREAIELVEAADGLTSALPYMAGWYGVDVPYTHLIAGDVAAARTTCDEALIRLGAVSRRVRLSQMLLISAVIALVEDDIERAERDAEQSLRLRTETGWAILRLDSLEVVAAVRAASGDEVMAVRLYAAAAAERARLGATTMRAADVAAGVVRLRASVGDEAFEVAWDEGARTSLEDAIAYALRGRGSRSRPTTGWLSLTPTEVQVADLVAEGLSNPEIADRLFMARRTVTTHLTHIFQKLGLRSRTELAAASVARRNPASSRYDT
ncbi:MAG TPA: LuxR C-terminal-related transcriptional regulator [Acidimicrobiales bacterium]|nr:LuxR C-terminal-related transcriptional regulator [Acidimicrobiales bacterium]